MHWRITEETSTKVVIASPRMVLPLLPSRGSERGCVLWHASNLTRLNLSKRVRLLRRGLLAMTPVGSFAKVVVMLFITLFLCGVNIVNAAPIAATDGDGDGLPDAWEIAAGLNPAAGDSDGDGYDDGREIAAGYDPLLPAPATLSEPLRALDTDGDALHDHDEIRWGTTVMERDTDGDGYDDGAEIAGGYDPKNPAPVRLTKRIDIVIAAQELRPFLGPYDLGAHPVSTGRQARPTPKGTFRIASKNPRAWSSLANLWMPWWMNFTGPGVPSGRYGIHELPEWPNGTKEGVAHLGTPVSGGCIRLGPDVASTIYRWADVGTTVVVR